MRPPVLSGIEQIDYALWLDGSGTTVRRILARAGDLSLRWVFVRDLRYLPFLEQAGFRPKQLLPGDIQVWENPTAPPLAPEAMRFGPPDAAGLLSQLERWAAEARVDLQSRIFRDDFAPQLARKQR